MQFVQAKHFTPTTGRQIDLIVIHDMEGPETATTAEGCANYFVDPRDKHGNEIRASAHYCIDSDSEVQCVFDKDVPCGAPGVNRNGLHFEHAGFASQSEEQWLDAYGLSMLVRSAKLVAQKCREFGIPVAWVDEDGLLAGARGITDHATATRAFKTPDGHTDPGPGFPREKYMTWVKDFTQPPKEWDEMASKAEVQAACKAACMDAIREVLDNKSMAPGTHNTLQRIDVIFESDDLGTFREPDRKQRGLKTSRKMITDIWEKVTDA